MPKPVVAYYRVSAREQSKSGLGIDARRAAVVRSAGFDLVAEFTEDKTGKGAVALNRRSQLTAALVEARRNGKAPVVVAKRSAYTQSPDESRVVRGPQAPYGAMMQRAGDSGAIRRTTQFEFTYSD